MIVDKEIVANIAELAQLEIPADAMQEYVNSLSRILHLAEEMQGADTDGIEPMSNPLDGIQKLRADTVTESDQRESYQASAPETSGGFYLVPKVIE